MLFECRKCGVEKPFTAGYFPFDKGDGKLRKVCKPCRAGRKRINRQAETPERRERRLAKARGYQQEHKEDICKARQIYLEKRLEENPDYWKQHHQKYQNREKARERRLADKERRREYNKNWARENRELSNGYYLKSKRKRRQSGMIRLTESVSSQIRFSLNHDKDGRSWEKLVGYTRRQLAEHIERQFASEMTWDNYGKWHIDHIIPVDSFSYSSAKDESFTACWALTNLRPLWAEENIKKGAGRIFLL